MPAPLNSREVKLIGRRGGDVLVDAGQGDALGMHDVILGRVYSTATDRLQPPLPLDAITGRGYWEPIGDGAGLDLDRIRERVAALS